jgi:hypothetical protein
LFSFSQSSVQFDEENVLLKHQKDGNSNRQSASPPKKLIRQQTSTDANTHPKPSTERIPKQTYPLQSNIDNIREK